MNVQEAASAWGLHDVQSDTDPRLALEIAATYAYRDGPSRITLVRRGSLWSFCLYLHTARWRLAYGPFMQHCPPHPSRESALMAACHAAEECLMRNCAACSDAPACECSAAILRWVRELEPVDTLTLW